MTHIVDYAALDTNQKLFDYVSAHLLKQNEQAADNVGSCFYRVPDHPQLMCAAGVCISDADYSEEMEGLGVEDLLNNYDFKISKPLYALIRRSSKLLIALQSIHDSDESEYWKQELVELARRFDLNGPVAAL